MVIVVHVDISQIAVIESDFSVVRFVVGYVAVSKNLIPR